MTATMTPKITVARVLYSVAFGAWVVQYQPENSVNLDYLHDSLGHTRKFRTASSARKAKSRLLRGVTR